MGVLQCIPMDLQPKYTKKVRVSVTVDFNYKYVFSRLKIHEDFLLDKLLFTMQTCYEMISGVNLESFCGCENNIRKEEGTSAEG